MANGPDADVPWEQVTELAEEYQIRLAFTADDWSSTPGWHGRSALAFLDLTFAEISGVGYPWIGLRDGELVGLLEKDGPAWPSLLDWLENVGPGTWSTTLLDGTVATYAEWLAEHPDGH